MTEMKRMTCSFPDDVVEMLEEQRTTGHLAGRPYSEIIRYYLMAGLGMEPSAKRKRTRHPEGARDSA